MPFSVFWQRLLLFPITIGFYLFEEPEVRTKWGESRKEKGEKELGFVSFVIFESGISESSRKIESFGDFFSLQKDKLVSEFY